MTEVEVEPKEFSDSSRNASKENEVASNNSELLQYFDKYPENKTGEFEIFIWKYYLILYRKISFFRLIFAINNELNVYVYLLKKSNTY